MTNTFWNINNIRFSGNFFIIYLKVLCFNQFSQKNYFTLVLVFMFLCLQKQAGFPGFLLTFLWLQPKRSKASNWLFSCCLQDESIEKVINDTESLFKSREKEYHDTINQIEVRPLRISRVRNKRILKTSAVVICVLISWN